MPGCISGYLIVKIFKATSLIINFIHQKTKQKMAKLKKYPKQPKASASVATLENYIAKCKEVDKANAQIESDKKKKKDLLTKISKIKRK